MAGLAHPIPSPHFQNYPGLPLGKSVGRRAQICSPCAVMVAAASTLPQPVWPLSPLDTSSPCMGPSSWGPWPRRERTTGLTHRAPFDRALVFVGAVLFRAQAASSALGAVHLGVAPPTTGVTQRARSNFLEDLDFAAKAQKPLSTFKAVTAEASIAPSLKRTMTSEGRPSNLIAGVILTSLLSASVYYCC